MKKISVSLLSTMFVLMSCVLSAQITAYEGTPPTFMTYNAPYMRASYGSSYSNPTATTGVLPGQSHSIIVTQSADQCRCYGLGIGNTAPFIQDNILPPNWDDGNPNVSLDTVMRLGCASTQGRKSQQVEYWFYPDTNKPVLLVYFSFAQDNVMHHTALENPRFYIQVKGENNQLLNLGMYDASHPYSQFVVVPLGSSPSTSPYPEATPRPASMQSRICPHAQAVLSDYDTEWFEYTPVAFDLSEQARNHQMVKFTVMVQGCVYTAHWAYCYFNAKLIPKKLDVDACGDFDMTMTAPWGFMDYQWFRGTDAATAQWFDPLDVNPSATNRIAIVPRDPHYPYYRCEMNSRSGVPFVYEGNITYYELSPEFSSQQVIHSCKYIAQFNNESTVGVIKPGAASGTLDTVWQETTYVVWDFGDGSPLSNEINPWHAYPSRFQPNGDQWEAKLYIYDNDHICTSDTISHRVIFDPVEPDAVTLTDTVRDCEENLPYIYKPEIFGDQYSFAQGGTYTVVYNDTCSNGCDSTTTVHVTLVVEIPKVQIEILTDYCDEFTSNLKAVTTSPVAAYLWNTGETTDNIVIDAPGTYSVEIADTNGCDASESIVIPACVPFINLPNSITPSDRNGINDYFFIPQQNLLSAIDFTVFNRWGEMVFHTTDKAFRWDGKVNGEYFFGTNYNYVLKIVDYNGLTTMYKGSILVY